MCIDWSEVYTCMARQHHSMWLKCGVCMTGCYHHGWCLNSIQRKLNKKENFCYNCANERTRCEKDFSLVGCIRHYLLGTAFSQRSSSPNCIWYNGWVVSVGEIQRQVV